MFVWLNIGTYTLSDGSKESSVERNRRSISHLADYTEGSRAFSSTPQRNHPKKAALRDETPLYLYISGMGEGEVALLHHNLHSLTRSNHHVDTGRKILEACHNAIQVEYA